MRLATLAVGVVERNSRDATGETSSNESSAKASLSTRHASNAEPKIHKIEQRKLQK